MQANRHAPRRGAVLVITLLALTLLVGLIFYVYNMGAVVNRRIEAQNAADAVAISGAEWMARSMNVIALNNVTQARLLALVAVLDAMPVAAEMTIKEEQQNRSGDNTLWKGLENQLRRGVPNTHIERDDFLRVGLQHLYDQMKPDDTGGVSSQLMALWRLDEAFNSPDERDPESGAMDIGVATNYRGSGSGSAPQGELWRAIMALGEMSEATAMSAGELAQANAVRWGRENLAPVAFLSPAIPEIPVRRGNWGDFGTVLMDSVRVDSYNAQIARGNLVGRLQGSRDVLRSIERTWVSGGATPDMAYPHRLGPWARLYRWRYNYHASGGVAGDRVGDPEYDASGPAGGTAGPVAGYRTWGPFHWALRQVTHQFGLTGRHGGAADTSRFSHHLRRVATLKLAYMFGLPGPQDIQYAQHWITDFNEARQFASDPQRRRQILRTQYYRAVVRSTVKWDSPQWLVDRDTYDGNIEPINNPRSAMWPWPADPALNGWYDIELRRAGDRPRVLRREFVNDRWQVVGELRTVEWERMGDYVWRVKKEYGVDADRELGLARQEAANGDIILHTVYSVGWYVFRGCEIRDPVSISSPCNWLGGDELPAPLLLDTSDGDYDPDMPNADEGYRREAFTFLGVARFSDRARIWPQQFTSANPSGQMLAVAQAKLFNNSSWDLWTQDWQVQLAPVTQWSRWVSTIGGQLGDYARVGDVLPDDQVRQAYEYMQSLSPELMDRQLTH